MIHHGFLAQVFGGDIDNNFREDTSKSVIGIWQDSSVKTTVVGIGLYMWWKPANQINMQDMEIRPSLIQPKNEDKK